MFKQRKRYNWIWLSVLSAAPYSLAFPGTMGEPSLNSSCFLSLSGGPVWAQGGQTQTFYLTPEIEKSYVAQKNTTALPWGELFLGVQRDIFPQLLSQVGIAFAISDEAKLKGIILDDADPRFDNHIYQYKVDHWHIALKGKVFADRGYWVLPWISGSIGVGFNQAHSFTNTPRIPQALPNMNFNSHAKTTFTYTVGAGFQKIINSHWQVGIGYEFADWGKSRLNRAPEQTLNQGLKLNHLYSNGFLVNLTYLL